MCGVGIINTVTYISKITGCTGQTKALGVPVPAINRAAIFPGTCGGCKTKMRRRITVPYVTAGLITEVFSFNERCLITARYAVTTEDIIAGHLVGLCRLAYHYPIVFRVSGERLVGIGRIIIAGANDAPAMRVKFLPHGHQLVHLLRLNNGVSCFPKQDAGVIAVKDHGGTHHFGALFPLTAANHTFFIASRAYFYYTHPVAS